MMNAKVLYSEVYSGTKPPKSVIDFFVAMNNSNLTTILDHSAVSAYSLHRRFRRG